jgi:hypothetical protein
MINLNYRLLVPGALLLAAIVLSPAPLPEAVSGVVFWLGIVLIVLSVIMPQTAAQPRTRRRKRRSTPAARAKRQAREQLDRSNRK